MATKRLKVFQAQFGFYDTVVAASSRAAALRAWGTHQDLFASGQAVLTEDASAIEAAIEHPETPLRRPIGSREPFRLDPTGTPILPDEPKRTAVKKTVAPGSKQKAPRVPRPADRSALDAAEASLRKVEDDRKKEEDQLQHRADKLEAEREAAQQRYVERRKSVAAEVEKARAAYRAAGGGA